MIKDKRMLEESLYYQWGKEQLNSTGIYLSKGSILKNFEIEKHTYGVDIVKYLGRAKSIFIPSYWFGEPVFDINLKKIIQHSPFLEEIMVDRDFKTTLENQSIENIEIKYYDSVFFSSEYGLITDPLTSEDNLFEVNPYEYYGRKENGDFYKEITRSIMVMHDGEHIPKVVRNEKLKKENEKIPFVELSEELKSFTPKTQSKEPVKKRGRGRPRKTETVQSDVATEPVKKRGPGRPRKAEAVQSDVATEPVKKRGPGRPRKIENQSEEDKEQLKLDL